MNFLDEMRIKHRTHKILHEHIKTVTQILEGDINANGNPSEATTEIMFLTGAEIDARHCVTRRPLLDWLDAILDTPLVLVRRDGIT